ncbi:hypothetical protein PtA15_3A308 [Puccinia triticina]|uniref:Uncharacterized protein n=1 Tax=Puccinia triticina TaxID=208348 RepID=A0ABY7CCI9_9BASI|nr:uncharacterized protein PtA15_3A308 [Puccinia triticina]WAQ82943.1 hypothetical protein PtA15_3A308 [Puccinia triticina]
MTLRAFPEDCKAALTATTLKSTAWNDETIATLVKKHLAAEKAGDNEASDLYFAMFKSLMSARPPLQATLNPVPASAEDLSSKTRPKKPVNPDPYAKYALIPNTSGSASLPAKPTGSRAPKGSGYKGNNFDPNHSAKQSAQGMAKIAQ